MTAVTLPGRLPDILCMLQLFDAPMFMVHLDPGGAMRFAGANAAHDAVFGPRRASGAGGRAEDVLPNTLAEALFAGVARCLGCGGAASAQGTPVTTGDLGSCRGCTQPASFEHPQETGGIRRWWRTTFVPVFDRDRAAAILGTSIDITAQRSEAGTSRSDMAAMRRRADRMQTRSQA